MFCVNCGKELLDYVRFCEYCGYKVDIEIDDIEEKNHHLWTRFFARTTDYLIIFAVSISIIDFMSKHFIDIIITDKLIILFIMIIMVSWIFIESILIHTFGTTPGKWLFNISIHKKDGEKIDFGYSINRSTLIWLKAYGMGIPFISIMTLLWSYYRLNNDKIFSWDKDQDIVITCKDVNFLRVFTFILFLCSMLIYNILPFYRDY